MTLKLHVPEARKKPDEFYEQVAARWTILTVHRPARHPANDLATANGVPVTTIHRWVKEARRRGMLAPGQRGGHFCRLCGQQMDEGAQRRYRSRQDWGAVDRS